MTEYGNFNGEFIVLIGIICIAFLIMIPKRMLERSSKPFDRAVLRFREWIFR